MHGIYMHVTEGGNIFENHTERVKEINGTEKGSARMCRSPRKNPVNDRSSGFGPEPEPVTGYQLLYWINQAAMAMPGQAAMPHLFLLGTHAATQIQNTYSFQDFAVQSFRL